MKHLYASVEGQILCNFLREKERPNQAHPGMGGSTPALSETPSSNRKAQNRPSLHCRALWADFLSMSKQESWNGAEPSPEQWLLAGVGHAWPPPALAGVSAGEKAGVRHGFPPAHDPMRSQDVCDDVPTEL